MPTPNKTSQKDTTIKNALAVLRQLSKRKKDLRKALILDDTLMDTIQKLADQGGEFFDLLLESFRDAVMPRIQKRVEKQGWNFLGGTFRSYFEPCFAPSNWQDCLGRFNFNATPETVSAFLGQYVVGHYGIYPCFAFSLGESSQFGFSRHPAPKFPPLTADILDVQALRQAGFTIGADDPSVYIPIVLDRSIVAAEYPKLNKSLAPIDAALDTIFALYPVFDEAVQKFRAAKSKQDKG